MSLFEFFVHVDPIVWDSQTSSECKGTPPPMPPPLIRPYLTRPNYGTMLLNNSLHKALFPFGGSVHWALGWGTLEFT